MLRSLHIENIAVIKSADIDFSEGFTVLTGETGAGKSIIIDSINLILGAKQSRELIRNGEEEAEVSALFDNLSDEAKAVLAEIGLDADENGEILFARTITAAGRSTVRFNGRTIPLSLARDAAKLLIGIHGQHDNITLLEPDKHILYLDEYAGIGEKLTEYSESYHRYCQINKDIAELKASEREKAQRTEFLKFQIEEIQSAKLKADEEELLLAKRSKLQNIEKISQLSGGVYSLLYQSESGSSALDKIKKAVQMIDRLSQMVPEAEKLSERLEPIIYELEDIAETAADYAGDIDGDPSVLLDRVENRLEKISRLERKYGNTVPEVLEYLQKTENELKNIEQSDEKLAEFENELAGLLPKLASQAKEISDIRKKAGKSIEKAIVSELSYLDMNGVEFAVDISGGESDGGFTAKGFDRVEFLISTNKGEPLKPLAKIASGGELSRIMLAVKTVLADRDGMSTLIFDEVDTGVSGKTSQKIGIKLKALAHKGASQVICVTHSAQIAALADNHLRISKSESDGRMETSVLTLDSEGRVREVARIMGGINITEKLLDTAREMIEESEKV